jgi:hypothetical protein
MGNKFVPMLARRKILPLAGLLLMAFASCSPPELSTLSLAGSDAPVQSQFNRDAGRVRLLLLLDPT